MHGVTKYIGKNLNKCDMCSDSSFSRSAKYIYTTWEMLPELPSRELEICKKCALREIGSKNKKNFDEIVKKRGKRYGDFKEAVQKNN